MAVKLWIVEGLVIAVQINFDPNARPKTHILIDLQNCEILTSTNRTEKIIYFKGKDYAQGHIDKNTEH